jgi:hypothetical protein
MIKRNSSRRMRGGWFHLAPLAAAIGGFITRIAGALGGSTGTLVSLTGVGFLASLKIFSGPFIVRTVIKVALFVYAFNLTLDFFDSFKNSYLIPFFDSLPSIIWEMITYLGIYDGFQVYFSLIFSYILSKLLINFLFSF